MISERIRRGVRAGGVTAAIIGAVALASASASAQQTTPPKTQPPPRRQETIEIRGQVPTPQVVTIRPRETPAYSRRVLVPNFLDHDFWPSILPPLEIIPARGPVRADSVSRPPADSTSHARSTTRPPSGTPPAPLRR